MFGFGSTRIKIRHIFASWGLGEAVKEATGSDGVIYDKEGTHLNTDFGESNASKFYASPEILKENSGYEFMNSLPVDTKTWVENCHPCQCAMSKIVIQHGTKLEGIIGTEVGIVADKRYWPAVYKNWLQNPTISSHGEFWVCPSCCGLWTNVGGFWAKVRVEGQESLSMDRLRETESLLRGAQIMAANELPDPGVKSSPDSTKCPHCLVWRDVRPYEAIKGESTGQTIHVCPKCATGDIIEPKEAPHVTNSLISQEEEI